MSSTKLTAPRTTHSERLTFPTISSSKGTTTGVNFARARAGAARSSGNCAVRASVNRFTSARAALGLTPGFRRAIHTEPKLPR
jgi:hypothetical protein